MNRAPRQPRPLRTARPGAAMMLAIFAMLVVGTATLENLPSTRYPDDESYLAPLISCQGRFFRFAKGSFAFGGTAIPEYVEVVPIVTEGTLKSAR